VSQKGLRGYSISKNLKKGKKNPELDTKVTGNLSHTGGAQGERKVSRMLCAWMGLAKGRGKGEEQFHVRVQLKRPGKKSCRKTTLAGGAGKKKKKRAEV